MFNERITASYSIALMRMTLGAAFVAHGAILKIGTLGLAGTMGYFRAIDYPPELGVLVAIAETAGGIALIFGLWTRWVSLGLLPILIGATLHHYGNGWLFSNAGGGWEFPALWTVLLVVQAGLGSGAFAISSSRLEGAARMRAA